MYFCKFTKTNTFKIIKYINFMFNSYIFYCDVKINEIASKLKYMHANLISLNIKILVTLLISFSCFVKSTLQ